jgi:hypothetical protein
VSYHGIETHTDKEGDKVIWEMSGRGSRAPIVKRSVAVRATNPVPPCGSGTGTGSGSGVLPF